MSRRCLQLTTLSIFVSAAVALLTGLASGRAPQIDSGPSVVAKVDGRPLERSEYLAFLHREYGPSRLASFIDDWLVQRRSKELGVQIDRPSVEKHVDQKIQREISRLFDGDAARFEASLAQRRMTIAQYREWQIVRESGRFLADECILAARVVTPDQVVAKFEELYGSGGTHRRIRHIFLLDDRDRAAKNSDDREVDTRAAELISAEILRALRQDPASFGECVLRWSDDGFSRANGGQLPGYRPGEMGFGEVFDRAVEGLSKPMETSGVIRVARGFHIVQLIAQNVTQFESVREEIESHLEAETPRAVERRQFIERLRKQALIESG